MTLFIPTSPGRRAAEPPGRGADSAGAALGQGSWRQPRGQGPPVALRMDDAGHLLPAGEEHVGAVMSCWGWRKQNTKSQIMKKR